MFDRSLTSTLAAEMRVCRYCGEIAGPFVDPRDGRVERKQLCACSAAANGEDGALVWPRYDFNTVVEICFCCCAEVIRSGFYVSPIFCPECAPIVEKLNATGSVSIPFVRPVKPRFAPPGDGAPHRRSSVIPRTGPIRRLDCRRRKLVSDFISDRLARNEDPTVAAFLAARGAVSREDAANELADLFRGWQTDEPPLAAAPPARSSPAEPEIPDAVKVLLTAILDHASRAKDDAATAHEVQESLSAIREASLRATEVMRAREPESPSPPAPPIRKGHG